MVFGDEGLVCGLTYHASLELISYFYEFLRLEIIIGYNLAILVFHFDA